MATDVYNLYSLKFRILVIARLIFQHPDAMCCQSIDALYGRQLPFYPSYPGGSSGTRKVRQSIAYILSMHPRRSIKATIIIFGVYIKRISLNFFPNRQ